jgi:hypothetical protein
LKIAYVNKERAAQHQESLLLKSIELAGEKAVEADMERERQNLIFQEEQTAEKRRADLIRQKSVLQKQMDERLVSNRWRTHSSQKRNGISAIIIKEFLLLFLVGVAT